MLELSQTLRISIAAEMLRRPETAEPGEDGLTALMSDAATVLDAPYEEAWPVAVRYRPALTLVAT